MFVRVKKRGNLTYYYLVESVRDGDKVRQKVLCYLGKTKPAPEALQDIMNEVTA